MQIIKLLLTYIKPYWWLAVLGPLFMFVEVAMDLIQPMIMQHMIDDGIANGDSGYTLKMGLYMIGAAVIGLIGGVGCSFFSSQASAHFASDLRQDVFKKIEQLSSQSIDSVGRGKLITIVTGDVISLHRALMMTLKIFVRGPFLFIGSIVIVYLTARELFPILAVIVPILMIVILLFTRKSGMLFKKVQEAMDRMNTRLQENLAGMRVVKAFARQKFEKEKFSEANSELTKRNIAAEQLVAMMMPILLFFVNIGIIIALLMGVFNIGNNSIQVGMVLAFINYLNIMLQGLMSSSNVLMHVIRAIPSSERIQEILDAKVEITESEDHIELKEVEGSLEFRNVSYSYSKNGEFVIENISFELPKGQTLGIIGSTGSGKTTLIKMIPRLLEPDKGAVLLDGLDSRKYPLATLRASIGVVMQKAVLFSGSIKENLAYGKENASDPELEKAAKDACAEEFIIQLEEGYNHYLTQEASNLSGGQKQRLAIARAFVRKPAILILDDSTSAVDALSEATIQQVLKKEYAETTKIIVSSKISSIKNADQIILLDDGKMVGLGSHEDLLTSNAIYQEIYFTQGGRVIEFATE